MKYFKNLSYLRVIACIAIVCTHISQRLMLEGRIYELTHYMQHLRDLQQSEWHRL